MNERHGDYLTYLKNELENFGYITLDLKKKLLGFILTLSAINMTNLAADVACGEAMYQSGRLLRHLAYRMVRIKTFSKEFAYNASFETNGSKHAHVIYV